ncbi:MAG: putative L-carnitine dehydratase [Rhodospirillales bacterium]|jgi:benzylsuccinate CoA-transferase BbsE subunit|nr:putative L-carnitine dehydratase [Rhodospirillales bacterium]
MTPGFRPYTGIRVLDLTHDLARYATRLFADLGAEVIRVEPPGGLPDRARDTAEVPGGAEAFAFHNASKQSVVLDLTGNEGRAAFADLAREAQVIVLERGGPLGAGDIAWLRDLNPTATITHVSPYGIGGPLQDAPASDLTLQAAGGIAWMTGSADEPPLRLPGGQSAMVVSVYAAVATAMCLFDAETHGRGHILDVSAQEAIAHSLQNAIQVWDLEKRVSHRAGEGTRDASENIYECRDGHVFLASPPTTGVSWKGLMAWMAEVDHPSRIPFSEPHWLDRKYRSKPEARAEFKPLFEAFTRNFTRQELVDNALKRRIVMAPVSRVRDVLDDPQLTYRDYFVPLGEDGPSFPGAPYKMSEPVWGVSPPPALGQRAARG